jgi:hypothetical protein
MSFTLYEEVSLIVDVALIFYIINYYMNLLFF